MAISKPKTLGRLAVPLVMPERPQHADAIETLVDLGFGPERFRKTAYRLRDGIAPIAELGLVALLGEQLVGTIRFWEVKLENGPRTLLLGPLAIHPDRQGQGIGRALMEKGLGLARDTGWQAVVLVGDAPYYTRFGFRRDLAQNLTLPGPVDPQRFLGLELTPGALHGIQGLVGRAKT